MGFGIAHRRHLALRANWRSSHTAHRQSCCDGCCGCWAGACAAASWTGACLGPGAAWPEVGGVAAVGLAAPQRRHATLRANWRSPQAAHFQSCRCCCCCWVLPSPECCPPLPPLDAPLIPPRCPPPLLVRLASFAVVDTPLYPSPVPPFLCPLCRFGLPFSPPLPVGQGFVFALWVAGKK